MSNEQETQWREEFESTISDLPLSSREERLRRLPHQSDKYFWNSIQSQWEGYLEARKKSQEEIDSWSGMYAIIAKRETNHLKELAKKDEIIKELKRLYFYADTKKWFDGVNTFERPEVMSRITSEDLSFIHIDNGLLGGVSYSHGGKLAREVKKKVEELENARLD